MENILHDFEEKVISLMTEFLKNSMEVGGLSNFTDNLNDKLMLEVTHTSCHHSNAIFIRHIN